MLWAHSRTGTADVPTLPQSVPENFHQLDGREKARSEQREGCTHPAIFRGPRGEMGSCLCAQGRSPAAAGQQPSLGSTSLPAKRKNQPDSVLENSQAPPGSREPTVPTVSYMRSRKGRRLQPEAASPRAQEPGTSGGEGPHVTGQSGSSPGSGRRRRPPTPSQAAASGGPTPTDPAVATRAPPAAWPGLRRKPPRDSAAAVGWGAPRVPAAMFLWGVEVGRGRNKRPKAAVSRLQPQPLSATRAHSLEGLLRGDPEAPRGQHSTPRTPIIPGSLLPTPPAPLVPSRGPHLSASPRVGVRSHPGSCSPPSRCSQTTCRCCPPQTGTGLS